MSAEHLVELVRECYVVGDHPAVAARTDLLEREPDLERAKSARVLWSVLEVVPDLLPFVVVELVVVRLERERVVKGGRVPGEDAAGFERSVQPFVGIDGDGIGETQSLQFFARVVERDGGRTVRAVDVKPQIVLRCKSLR